MASRTPSYIYQSPHGIWYFQVWIPERHRKASGQKKLIRKSLRTRSRKHALRLARELWVKVEKLKYDWEDQAERDIAVEERLYFKGKSLSAQVEEEGIDLTNPYEKDNFFETLIDWEIEALAFYENYQFEQRQSALMPSDPQPAVPNSSVLQQIENLQPPGIKPSKLRLSDIVKKWIHTKSEVGDEEKRWSTGTTKKYRSDLTTFVNMVGDPKTHELTEELIQDLYEDRLPDMPKGMGNKPVYHNGQKPLVDHEGEPVLDRNGKLKTEPIWKPIEEILEIAKKSNDEGYDKKTIARSASFVSTFLRWAEKRKRLQTGLHVVLEDLCNSADTKKPTGTYFTDEDLRLLFENEVYRKGQLIRYPYRHWIPLLLLYTGARLGEVSQLRVVDVERIDGIWAILIRKYDDSSTVKGQDGSYVRIVPLHKELEKLGFRTFVDQMKAKGETHLFSVLSPLEGNNNWGRAATRWFNGENKKGYLEQCGIPKTDGKGKRKNLHSFRYTWITQAKHNKLDHDMRRELCGHASGRKSDVHDNYEGDYPLADRKKAMNKLAFNFDVEAIKKWR
ncbi:MAG: site-specific integrase [Candidatus Thiodiazotropha sp. (ex Lucina aurantia)]|nr:site-specific integrase [Candidatus Thiodiazotropha sp. (ex Lucina pensylvanica)]MBT3025243.1 site-specific integrase [Candidatus Thiodiazotropha taylori]MBV2098386.1 site-specific integrase [Candidatus Thiodiazotropha sp. (ex Codakia orbicularis)]MBV2105052.1 site-specific integrase [Candidatus Thiodiazotropha sp. (ex Lucina aurantia)]MBV2118898.1 site-specific integrase [Candidatus Thiodiazotropha sp. (ex Lucina aurantia)]